MTTFGEIPSVQTIGHPNDQVTWLEVLISDLCLQPKTKPKKKKLKKKHIPLGTVIGEIFGHNRLVEILVFATPTGYMLTTSGFPLLNWGIFYRFFLNDG